MSDNFVIQFSQEELLYLLRRQGLPDLPGMGEHPWGEIPQNEALRILETAGRGLMARGAITIHENSIQIDKALHAILVACAYPEQMVILNPFISNQANQENYFRVTEFDVRHTLPYPWVHRFEVFSTPGSDMGFSQVMGWLEPNSGGQISSEFIVEQQKLQEVYALVSSDVALAQSLLVESGLPAEISAEFLDVLKKNTIKILVQAVSQLRPELRQKVFTVLVGALSCWIVTAGQSDNTIATIMQVDRSYLDAALLSAFTPFLSNKNQ